MSPLTSRLHNQMILAPLTRGGNLPFRRLCADFGTQGRRNPDLERPEISQGGAFYIFAEAFTDEAS